MIGLGLGTSNELRKSLIQMDFAPYAKKSEKKHNRFHMTVPLQNQKDKSEISKIKWGWKMES
jgi:hypothetical protein